MKTLKDLQVTKGMKALVRFDFNVSVINKKVFIKKQNKFNKVFLI